MIEEISLKSPSILGYQIIPPNPLIGHDFVMSIVRASTHQKNANFSIYRNGEQSLSQAVAALIMQRHLPSHTWNKTIVDEILRLGEKIQNESLSLHPDGVYQLPKIAKKIEYLSRIYGLDYKEFAFQGLLGPSAILAMKMKQILSERTSCIIVQPIVLAVWCEHNKFFMYDPNERNQYGRLVGPNVKGSACVTRFNSLRDLTLFYYGNIPQQPVICDFQLSSVTVNVLN